MTSGLVFAFLKGYVLGKIVAVLVILALMWWLG